MDEIEKIYDNANIETKKYSEYHNNMDCGRVCYSPLHSRERVKIN